MTNASASRLDAIIIGGGPGGSTAASLVAMQGHRVLLLERDRFPRYQIGESLLPATVHGICGMLGVTEKLAQSNFPRKRGGTFRWGNSPEPWTFGFAKNPDAPGGFAYQVERAKFDKILLDNCREKGVDVRESHRVEEILFDNGRATGVRFLDDRGEQHFASARFIVDAGGSRSRQYNPHVGERIYSQFFQNIALHGYFENGKRLPSPNEGNILCCTFTDGWFWYIPLSDSLTSVGAVVSRDAAKLLQGGHEKAFAHFIKSCSLISDFLAPAHRITGGMYGELRVRRDYSYCNSRFCAPGLILVGDAACFVDPVFSSGVHLATYAGLLAARSVNTCISGRLSEEACSSEYERRYRREFGNFYQFLTAFYDVHQDPQSYFWTARKILKTPEQDYEAFVRLVAGVSADDEPLFSLPAYFHARIGLGEWFSKNAERSAGTNERPDRGAVPPPAASAIGNGFDTARFMQDLTAEITQIQLQGLFGRERPQESPIVGGLIPSRDGFHWTRATGP